jgi:hypothetical protein
MPFSVAPGRSGERHAHPCAGVRSVRRPLAPPSMASRRTRISGEAPSTATSSSPHALPGGPAKVRHFAPNNPLLHHVANYRSPCGRERDHNTDTPLLRPADPSWWLRRPASPRLGPARASVCGRSTGLTRHRVGSEVHPISPAARRLPYFLGSCITKSACAVCLE